MMNKKTLREPVTSSVSPSPTWPRAVAIALWTLLVAAGFWGPYLHLPISMSVLTGFYGVFVLVAAATAVLGLLRRGAAGEK